MQEIQNFINNNQFLSWYLNPRSRMSKKMFIWATTALFIVGAIFYYMDFKDTISDVSKSVNAMKFDQYQQSSRRHLSKEQIVNQLLNPSEDSDDIAKELGETFGIEGFSSESAKEKPFPWSKLVNTLIFIIIIPMVMMRLRDMGKKEPQVIKLTALIYLPIAMDTIELLGINISYYLYIPASVVGFILFTWLYMAKSEEYIPPSQRAGIPTPPKPAMPDPTPLDKRHD